MGKAPKTADSAGPPNVVVTLQQKEAAEKGGGMPDIVGLIKSLAWPLVVLYIFYAVSPQVIEILRQVPLITGRANVITFGDLKIELDRKITDLADPGVRAAIAQLDEDTYSRLMNLSVANHYCTYSEPREHADKALEVDRRLAALGFIALTEDPVGLKDRNDRGEKNLLQCYIADPTELGERARKVLISFLAEYFKS